MMTGIFQDRSLRLRAPQRQQVGSAVGVISWQFPHGPRDAVGSRPHEPHSTPETFASQNGHVRNVGVSRRRPG